MMIYRSPNLDERIVLADEVLEYLSRFRQVSGRDEAGGQLFAKYENDSLINVVRATGPSIADRRTRFRFVARRWREQIEINCMYRRGLHYVGDWHTHPQDFPEPSQHDIASIVDCYRKSRKSIRGFLLVIVGLKPFPAGLYVGLADNSNVDRLASTGPS